jgi:hypothetical protein
MDYLLWTLMLIGWVYLLTEAAILAPVRITLSRAVPIAEALVYCPSCVGFWVGVALAATGWWPRHDIAADYTIALQAMGESAIAAMAVANTWSKLTGGSAAWDIERGEDDTPQESQERKEG